jgi:hypothetical protein
MFKPVLLGLLREAYLAEQAFVQGLDARERAAIGTPQHWSAKDHIAHLAYWRQRLAIKLQAVLEHDTPDIDDFESINPRVFVEHRHRPWPDVLFEAKQAYTTQTVLVGRLTDDDLLAFDRFDWVPDGQPLHALVMGSSYEHAQQHLAQFHLDRGDLLGATQVQELWVARVVQTDTPPAMKGLSLYNLACFQATHEQVEKATASLAEALAIYPGPRLKEFSLTDPDLIALRL